MKHNPGIGATDDLSLRVSVATLVRVVFQRPLDGEWMLALERKATLHEAKVEVKSQPFGGAIRILDLNAIYDLIGDFHFDSQRSYAEQDFRIFIRPLAWSVLREFCIEHLSRVSDSILETDPRRELVEEFSDTLKVILQPGQYAFKPMGIVVEDKPAPTENFHSRNSPTVWLYRIFEAQITDSPLISSIIKKSEEVSHQALQKLALVDKQNGGKGWASAVLALPLKHLIDHYLSKPPIELMTPIWFETNRLDETISAVLKEISIPKYQRL